MIGEITSGTQPRATKATVKALRATLALEGELSEGVLTDYFDRSGPAQERLLLAARHAGAGARVSGSSSFSWLRPGLTLPLPNRPSLRRADQGHCETVLRSVLGMAGGQLLVSFCSSGWL